MFKKRKKKDTETEKKKTKRTELKDLPLSDKDLEKVSGGLSVAVDTTAVDFYVTSRADVA